MDTTLADVRIKEAQFKISEAIQLLRDVYNGNNTTMYDMAVVADYARLLNATDFEKTITG